MVLGKKKKYQQKILLRKKEARKSMKILGIKNFYFQNIPTRTLKTKIEKTYRMLEKIIKEKKLILYFVQPMKVVIKIMTSQTLYVQNLSKTVMFMSFQSIIFLKNN